MIVAPNRASAKVRQHMKNYEHRDDVQRHVSEYLPEIVAYHILHGRPSIISLHERMCLQKSRTKEEDWNRIGCARHNVEEKSLLHLLNVIIVADDGAP